MQHKAISHILMIGSVILPHHSIAATFFFYFLQKKTRWRIRGGLAPETLPGCADSDNHVQLGAVLPTFDREVRGPGGATRGCINDWMQKRHPMQSPCITDVVSNLDWPNHNNVNLSMLTSTGRSKLSGPKRERPAMKAKTMRVTTASLRTAWAENLAMCEGLKGRKHRHLNKIWTASFWWEKPLSWLQPLMRAKLTQDKHATRILESAGVSDHLCFS